MATPAWAEQTPGKPAAAGAPAAASQKPGAASAQKPAGPVQHFDIDDFAVQGVETLPQIDLEEAIYPFLGPNKSAEDVEKARAALEKAYHDKGYQTVSVAVPQQNVQGKVVVLKVTELKVGKLRVKNSRYFDLDKIKDKAASLHEGRVPNFNDVTKDIVALNQWPDRRVTPALRAGDTPGTVDVDLNVEDKPPLHGSLEVNNRQSPNTTSARVSATGHYDNLWQLGDSFSFTYQVAPQRRKDAEVFSASYLAHHPDIDWLSFLFYGVKSDSDVATVGGTNIVGPGTIIGSRAVITLPSRENFFQTLSVGVDFKHFDQTVSLGADSFGSPVTYYPIVGTYTANFQNEKFTTQFDASLTYNIRPLSDDVFAFDNKRFDASPSFTHVNLDVSHTHELPKGYQLYGKVQAQFADGPLVSSEQLSAGGLDTVRGYLESETLGDDGVIGNIELRSPNLGEMLQKHVKDETGQGAPRFVTFNDWRFYTFADAGHVSIQRALPEQQDKFDLWSYGVGTRFKVFNTLNGIVNLAVPMTNQAFTRAGDPRVNVRVWGEF
ncbi:MAG: ShlB/FhaC/HecB family hemolysin secretion/activation protein [Bradyrhizobium sp.]|uniref:ShlB/FhaC/HecB family hemolysin secretion/activation protein n=1 Tax=Bradyrhizobium sp. TaxID=376 RepID=UPI001DDEFF63|nr:ShlB/FhaC/HecB family hemolysin secretion/activation protein [Bradyrhizobium sp.]MBV9563127.1 ShlB/FhaC/HecB family hemolysin secretion/activation protein [Bradyrhizobium sp.]